MVFSIYFLSQAWLSRPTAVVSLRYLHPWSWARRIISVDWQTHAHAIIQHSNCAVVMFERLLFNGPSDSFRPMHRTVINLSACPSAPRISSSFDLHPAGKSSHVLRMTHILQYLAFYAFFPSSAFNKLQCSSDFPFVKRA